MRDSLVAASLLARYGKDVLVWESHGIAGGAAHSFFRQGFKFDSGPSFYCGKKRWPFSQSLATSAGCPGC